MYEELISRHMYMLLALLPTTKYYFQIKKYKKIVKVDELRIEELRLQNYLYCILLAFPANLK